MGIRGSCGMCYFGDCGLYLLQQQAGHPFSSRDTAGIFAVGHDLIQVGIMCVELVDTALICHPQVDKEDTRQTRSKSGQIDQKNAFMPFEIPDRERDIMFEHIDCVEFLSSFHGSDDSRTAKPDHIPGKPAPGFGSAMRHDIFFKLLLEITKYGFLKTLAAIPFKEAEKEPGWTGVIHL